MTFGTGRGRRIDAVIALLFLSFCLTLLDPSRALAAGATSKETALQRIQRSVWRINQQASTPEGEAAVLRRLSAQFRVSEDSLRAQHEAWALGYGEVAMVYGFARAARKSATPSEVVDLRRSGMDWKAIAKELGVSVNTVASRVHRNEGPSPRKP